jgi:hypothetical protein
MAILRCTELLLTKNLIRRRIHICCDSMAAQTALVKTTAESFLLWECMQVLGKLSELNKVTLVRIPGNEEADRLAKEGAIQVPPNQFTAIPFSVDKKRIKKQLEVKHQDRWTACTGCRQSNMLMRYTLSSIPKAPCYP